MKHLKTIFVGAAATRHRSEAKTPLLLLVCLGLLAGGIILFITKSRQPRAEAQAVPATLSDATRGVLARLNSPAELRLYSILEAAEIDPGLRPFSTRVRELLGAYEAASGKMIRVKVFDSGDTAPAAAAEEGIRPFNIEKGDACFLGLVAQVGDHKQVLASLAPAFENALEADITRALLRALEAGKTTPGVATVTEPDAATIESVKATLPNYASIPLEEGTRVLREGTLVELQKVGEESEAKIAAAQAVLARAQESGSEAEKEAARKALTQAERDKTQRMQEVLSTTAAQIRALENLKSAGR